MIEFFASLLEAIATFGSSAGSIIFSYEPEVPDCLIEKD